MAYIRLVYGLYAVEKDVHSHGVRGGMMGKKLKTFFQPVWLCLGGYMSEVKGRNV